MTQKTTTRTGARTSKRSRGNRREVEATSSDTMTLDQLRLLAYQHFDVHPKNVALYQCGRLIEGEGDVTLRGVFLCGVCVGKGCGESMLVYLTVCWCT